MTFDELKEKALSLPYAPGVYIMRDKTDKVIYVGKAKKTEEPGNAIFSGYRLSYRKNQNDGQ